MSRRGDLDVYRKLAAEERAVADKATREPAEDCACCGETMGMCEPNEEPTPLCDWCAHDIAGELGAALPVLADAVLALADEVELLRAVVEALPRCEAATGCRPAMRDYDPPGQRQLLCDEHQPTDPLFVKYPYRKKYLNDLRHAAALRVLLAKGGAR